MFRQLLSFNMIYNSIFYIERKQKKEKIIEDLTSVLKLKEGIIQ